VTRLGEIFMFSLGRILKITKVAQIFGFFFYHGKSYVVHR
jgi:hypothetical protein